MSAVSGMDIPTLKRVIDLLQQAAIAAPQLGDQHKRPVRLEITLDGLTVIVGDSPFWSQTFRFAELETIFQAELLVQKIEHAVDNSSRELTRMGH